MVLELGAGLGALTDALLALGCRVIAIERDRDLVPVLCDVFAPSIESGRLELLEADAKTADWRELLEGADRAVIAGNLPYQITGPLLQRTIALGDRIARAVFLVQKEVADRLAAVPGNKQYGALSVFVQARFRVRKEFVIKRGSFYPAPNVDSAVVVLDPHARPISEETPLFRELVRSAFHSRRKTLRNAWKGVGEATTLEGAATSASVSLDARGETLSVQKFADVARYMEEAAK